MNFLISWLIAELDEMYQNRGAVITTLETQTAALQQRIWRIYRRVTIITAITVTIGYLLNYWGFQYANTVIGIAFNLGMISLAVRYNRNVFVSVATTSLLDLFRNKVDKDIRDNVVIASASRYMLYTSLYFLFASVHSFKFSPGGALIAIMAFICLAWMDVAWKYDPRLFKPFAFIYCATVIIWAITITIQPVTYVGIFGKDIVSFIRPSSSDDDTNAVIMSNDGRKKRMAIKALKDASEAAEENPTPENEKKVEEAEKNLQNLSAIGKLSSVFQKEATPVASAAPSPAPVAQPAPQVAVAVTPAGHYGEPDRKNVRVIASDTDTPLNPGTGVTTPYWVKVSPHKIFGFNANNHRFTVVTEDNERFDQWDKTQVERMNKKTFNTFYLENRSNQASDITTTAKDA